MTAAPRRRRNPFIINDLQLLAKAVRFSVRSKKSYLSRKYFNLVPNKMLALIVKNGIFLPVTTPSPCHSINQFKAEKKSAALFGGRKHSITHAKITALASGVETTARFLIEKPAFG